MPTDRVLIEIVTAANMAGVEQAKAGMLGMNASTLGLAAALGGLVLIGKSAIENTEAQEKAHRSLAQAVAANDDTLHKAIVTHADTSKETEKLALAQRHLKEVVDGMPTSHKASKVQLDHLADAHAAVTKASAELVTAQQKVSTSMATEYINLDGLQTEFDAWAETNKRYITDQYAAEEALAAFVRAGASAPDAMRELNDALDLSTLRGLSMEDAQKQITLALTGSSKALKVLGITTDEYNAIMHDKTLTTEQKHLALLHLIESKTKDGRKAQTDLTQSTQALNKDWQDISTKVGPPLLDLFTFIVGKADDLVNALKNLGANKDWNKAISAGLGAIQNLIVGVVEDFRAIVSAVQWLIDNGSKIGQIKGSAPKAGASTGSGHRAAGGEVLAGVAYTVGEKGPETLVLGSSGGYILPNGGRGGGDFHLHIQGGFFLDDGPSMDRLGNYLAQRLTYTTGR